MFAQNKYCIHFQEVDVSALSSYATIQELIKLKLFWLYGLLLLYLLGSSDIYELYFLCLFVCSFVYSSVDKNLSSDYKSIQEMFWLKNIMYKKVHEDLECNSLSPYVLFDSVSF